MLRFVFSFNWSSVKSVRFAPYSSAMLPRTLPQKPIIGTWLEELFLSCCTWEEAPLPCNALPVVSYPWLSERDILEPMIHAKGQTLSIKYFTQRCSLKKVLQKFHYQEVAYTYASPNYVSLGSDIKRKAIILIRLPWLAGSWNNARNWACLYPVAYFGVFCTDTKITLI